MFKGARVLFHISENGSIAQFEPKVSTSDAESVVWAIDAERLRNYLVPRECPRVTYYAGPHTTGTDAEQFLGGAKAVVAIERGWLQRVQECRLFCYHMPADTFECVDDCAGYFASRVSVTPACIEPIDNVLAELRRRGVAVRTVANLWPLRDAIVRSTLQFSMIRMRNALPRPAV